MAMEYFLAYHSYLESMEPLSDAERGRLFAALLEYSRTGIAPELRGGERYTFAALKGNIDRDVAKYNAKCAKNKESAGKRWDANGCERMRTDANGCQDKDKEEDKDKEKDKDNTATAVDARAEAVSRVMARYMDCIDPTPSSAVAELLIAYTEELSADVVLHAIDIASGEGKRWSYIQAILKRYARSKLDTLAKVKADEEAHEQRKSRSTSAVNRYAGPTQEEFEKMKQLAERLSQA